MSLRKSLTPRRHDLSFQLTLLYAAILTCTLIGTLLILYFSLDAHLRRQMDLDLLTEWMEFKTLFEEGGVPAVAREMVIESESEGIDHVFFRLVGRDGRTVVRSEPSAWLHIATRAVPVDSLLAAGKPRFDSIPFPDEGYAARVFSGPLGEAYALQIVHSLKNSVHFQTNLAASISWSVGALVLVGLSLGWLVSRRATAGIQAITRAAEQIASGAFDTRVRPQSRFGEIETLAATFNKMLDRIQQLMTELREVTDNIAHDLRSPIARIRGAAEMALTRQGRPGDCQAVMAGTIGECDHLLAMVDTMLLISEFESGLRPVGQAQVDLGPIIDEACDLFEPVATEKGLRLGVHGATEGLPVTGDKAALQRMVANLLDNALKYTPAGGHVEIQAASRGEWLEIRFQDTGAGIAEKDLPHVFERFFRGDPSRRQPGSGLGLSLAQAVARAHGGAIAIRSAPSQGTLVTVRLPRAR
jgi:heavy metal sensor kinase